MSSIIFREALAFLKFISEEKIDEPAIWRKTVHKLVVIVDNLEKSNKWTEENNEKKILR